MCSLRRWMTENKPACSLYVTPLAALVSPQPCIYFGLRFWFWWNSSSPLRPRCLSLRTQHYRQLQVWQPYKLLVDSLVRCSLIQLQNFNAIIDAVSSYAALTNAWTISFICWFPISFRTSVDFPESGPVLLKLWLVGVWSNSPISVEVS